MTIHYRTSTFGCRIDGSTQLQIPVRNDKELYRTAHGVDNMINSKRNNKQAHITINHHFPGAKHKIRTGNDEQVANHNGMSQRNVIVLIDHCSHRITASSRTITSKPQSSTASHEEGTDNCCHKRLIVKQRRHTYRMNLYEASHRCKDSYTINRLGTEFPTQDTECNQQQKYVERQISDRSRNAKSPAEDRGDTAYSTHRDMIREEE